MFFLTEDLLSSAKLRSMAPISQTTFQDSDLITIANEELQDKIVPDIMSTREEYFVTSESVSITANIDHYLIPSRAIGNALQILFYVDTAGNRKTLVHTDTQRSADYINMTGEPDRFYIEGDEVVILPKPALTSGSLLFYFFSRPSKIVATTSVAKITAVNSSAGTTTFTVDTDLTASLTTGSLIDVQKATSPFKLWAYKKAITAITSTTIAVATTDVSDAASNVLPQVGDYVCPTGQTNIPQVPQEYHPLLAQLMAERLVMALGDLAKLQAIQAHTVLVKKNVLSLIQNRIETGPEKVNTRGQLLSALSGRG